MALSRGKKMTQTPSGSNIRVNAPDYASILNAPINALQEKAQMDDRRDQLNFQREGINFQRQEAIKNAELTSLNNQKKEIIKADKDQQKLFEKTLKEAQDLKKAEAKAKADRLEAANEVAFLKHSTAMTNFAWDLELKHPNNPDAIVSQMEEYYNKITTNKENAVWLKDEKRFYKFFEKYSQLYRGAVGEATKKFDSFQEEQHWESLTNYAEKLITNTEIGIARIETEVDIPQYLNQITEDINTLQNHMNSYDSKWGYKMIHTPEELDELMYNLISARDTKFISHIIDRFVLGDAPNQNNVNMAKALLEHIKQDKLPTAFEGDPRVPPDTYNMKSIYEVLSMISDYTNSSKKGTIDQYQPDDRNTIIDNISTSIENAENDYKKQLKEQAIDHIANLEQTTKRYLDKDSKEWVGSLNSPLISKEELYNTILTMDRDGNIFPDVETIKKIQKLQKTKKDVSEIVQQVITDDITVTDIQDKLAFIDLESLGFENGNINGIYQLAVEQAFGGENFNPVVLFENIFTKDGLFKEDPIMERGIAMMKKLNYWHPKLSTLLNNFKTSEFENEEDSKYLVALAVVKNRVLGKGDSANIEGDISKALNFVWEDYEANKSFSQASLRWKDYVNDKYSKNRNLIEGVDTWWTTKSGFLRMTGQDQVEDNFLRIFTKANNRENVMHMRFWLDVFTPKAWEDTELDNLIIEKHHGGWLAKVMNKVLPGTALDVRNPNINFSITESASDWIQNYVKNKMPDYLKNYANPSEQDYQEAYDDAFTDGIKIMSKNKRFRFSTVLYDPSTIGFVLTENRPEDKILGGAYASDPQKILTNANAYVGFLMFNEKDQNELAFSVFGETADYITNEEKNALFRDFMSMSTTGRLKLKEVQDQQDLNNPAYYIMLDVDGDGSFIQLTQNGKGVEWEPNTQYTDSPFGYSHNQIAQKWATDLVDGKTGIGSYNLDAIGSGMGIDIRNLSGEDRVDMIKMLTHMIHADDTFRGVLGSLLFPNDDVSGGDKNIDRLTEFHSKLVGQFKDYRKTVNEEIDYAFNTEQEAFVFGHKTKYDQELFEMEEGLAKVKVQQEKTKLATEEYDKVYGVENSSIIIPPKYKFIMTDIIEALPNKWEQLIGEGTQFHEFIMQENYLDAGDELGNFESYMNEEKQLQRLYDLINFWGRSFN